MANKRGEEFVLKDDMSVYIIYIVFDKTEWFKNTFNSKLTSKIKSNLKWKSANRRQEVPPKLKQIHQQKLKERQFGTPHTWKSSGGFRWFVNCWRDTRGIPGRLKLARRRSDCQQPLKFEIRFSNFIEISTKHENLLKIRNKNQCEA